MKVPSLEYDQLVQKFLDEGRCVSRSAARRVATMTQEKEARGNVSSEKLTPDQCSAEIEKSSEGVFNAPMPNFQATTELGNVQPKRRGRPPGSKNKPKPPKEAK